MTGSSQTRGIALAVATVVLVIGPAAAPRSGPAAAPPDKSCVASYYYQSQLTASGELFDPEGRTAAHPGLPFGTRIRVHNPQTGRSVDVEVTDRGPFRGGRCLDLARGAFRRIAPLSAGLVRISYRVLSN